MTQSQPQSPLLVPMVQSPAPYHTSSSGWGLTHWGTDMVDVLFDAYVNGDNPSQRNEIATSNFARYGIRLDGDAFTNFLLRHYGILPYYGFKGLSYRNVLDRIYAEIPYEPECERARINDAVRICDKRYLTLVDEMDLNILYRDLLVRLYGSPFEPAENIAHANKLIQEYRIVDGSVYRPPLSL